MSAVQSKMSTQILPAQKASEETNLLTNTTALKILVNPGNPETKSSSQQTDLGGGRRLQWLEGRNTKLQRGGMKNMSVH
jgi:hypothetical protein